MGLVLLGLNNYMIDFTEENIERYSRNIILPEVGGAGQKKLLESKVLIIGAGGLGSPMILYLAASGVGNITIIDDDLIELSNLQRQIIHDSKKIGVSKALNAKKMALKINPTIKVTSIQKRFNLSNASSLIKEHDIIADGSDNFKTRFITGDSCFLHKKTLVSAAILKYEGQITSWNSNIKEKPCYRCLFPEQPKAIDSANCSEAGIIGPLAGIMGSMQATEVIKEILEIGSSLTGYIQIFDILNNRTRKIKVNKDPKCLLCSKHLATQVLRDEKFYEK